MLLEYDRLQSRWNNETNWVYHDDDDEDIMYGLQLARARARQRLNTEPPLQGAVPLIDMAFVGHAPDKSDDAPEIKDSCFELQARLATNFFQTKCTVGWGRMQK